MRAAFKRGPCAAVRWGLQARRGIDRDVDSFSSGQESCRKARPRLTDLPDRDARQAPSGVASLLVTSSLAKQRKVTRPPKEDESFIASLKREAIKFEIALATPFIWRRLLNLPAPWRCWLDRPQVERSSPARFAQCPASSRRFFPASSAALAASAAAFS
jgi:hypothetical protein